LEQRRTQRYKLQLPLHIVQLGDQRVDLTEQTRDISSGGVCFLSPKPIDVGDRIEYLITLSGSTPPVRIRCLGKVTRSHQPGPNGVANGVANGHSEHRMYEIAVTMERYQFVRAGEPDIVVPATVPATVS
jgi:hypothetical protein